MQQTTVTRLESVAASPMSARYDAVRSFTEYLCEPLCAEDCVIQSMPDVSPTRWHLAHTTWFFETFVLKQADSAYRSFHPAFAYLFNSYYNAVGEQYPRIRRGLLSRPTVIEVYDYRNSVDEAMRNLLDRGLPERIESVVELGLNHEQQHQELIVTDIKHVLSCNPLHPVYRERSDSPVTDSPPHRWLDYEEGLREIGFDGPGFCFDNETPRHRVFLESYSLGSRLVTNAEYLEFMRDGGYTRPELWLSLGWNTVKSERWEAPLYWERDNGKWRRFSLHGMLPVNPADPVSHVSYFEADAYARWAGARLPTEAEWEVAAETSPIDGNFVESGKFEPSSSDARAVNQSQLFGDVWEWTASPYVGYPGYRAAEGALGEYNGKFMCNQYVLRGGSCATSKMHIRPTYRNFFPPDARWQFTGIRLGR